MLAIIAAVLLGAHSVAPVDTARVRFDITSRSREQDIQIELSMATGDSVVAIRLPDQWAGRTALYAKLLELSPVGEGARVMAGADSAHRIYLSRKIGDRVQLRWLLHRDPPGLIFSDAHNHDAIGDHTAQLIGFDAFALPDVPGDTPVRAEFIFHGLGRGSVIATSYGVVRSDRDSVIVMRGRIRDLQRAAYVFEYQPGAIHLISSRVKGGTVAVAIRGRHAIDDSALASNVSRVIDAERTFWNGPAPADYLVTIGVASRGTRAGTQLTNTFVADLDSTMTLDADVIELFGHELMHEWIGDALHPDSSVSDGELSWFTEGFTDFLSKRLIWRAGLISDSAYIGMINRSLRNQALSAVRDLDWPAVVRGYWTNSDIKQQPYLRGELLALRLDTELRTVSKGARTVDQVLLELYGSTRDHQVALTRDRLVTSLAGALGVARVNGIVDSVLRGGVLRLPAESRVACGTLGTVEMHRWEPGFDLDSSVSTKTVHGVQTGSAAEQAGLRTGMAIRGVSIWRGDVTKPIELTIREDTTSRKISFMPVGREAIPVQQFTPGPGTCRGQPSPARTERR